ncbi:oxidoreductase [Ascidiimonas aurantiaca]|uniref:WD40/YVTN/BNR-like repeat-containing protein n=1 Tax=Ascidiimonas aurantiaca TaxID=1685432 RepID=UPI0030EE50F4
MKIFVAVSVFFCVISCKKKEENRFYPVNDVTVQVLYEDSVSIRAIALSDKNVAFAGTDGKFGLYNSTSQNTRVNIQFYDTITPDFRAVAFTSNDFFMISIENPALIYKTGNDGNMQLVYKEEHEKVFYDAMLFWNDREGMAIGDPTNGCLSIIITRDGGNSWKKLDCSVLPETAEGEAAFAASNSNIAMVGEYAWVASGGVKSRVFFTPDKGKSWEVFGTPIIQGSATKGMYSIDFYDKKRGVAIGGDYTDPENNERNKIITDDGGRTWKLIAKGTGPGYKSCVQYIPGSNAQKMVAVGFTGISVSNDGGNHWKHLSDEGFYTLRFLNDSVAYAAGKGRLAKLTFK